jgi:hypothetical protein
MPPFTFVGCIELREILGSRARDERELMEELEQAPLGAVYYHTHSVFLRHPQTTRPFPNDFANWEASQIRDQVLAERLGMVDPFQVASLDDLREEMVDVIDDHVSRLHPVPRIVFGDPFVFVQSHVIEVPTAREARTLAEFRDCLAQVDASAIYLHALHARIRRGVRGGDFAHWVTNTLGMTALGEAMAGINPYLGGLEEMRRQTLRLIDIALAAEPTPEAGVRDGT